MSKKIEKTEEVKVEPIYDSIYTQYDYILRNYENGSVRTTHGEIMDILRYCERKIGNNIPFQSGCSTCVSQILKLFKDLKKQIN